MITGHSLGGAMAVFAATDLINVDLAKNLKLYTFGQPRTGTGVWADRIMRMMGNSHCYFRVVNKQDPASHLPPHTFKVGLFKHVIGYVHSGTEIWYPNGAPPLDAYIPCKYDSKIREDTKCSHGKKNFNGADHLMYLGKPIPGRCVN